jgi:signal transduction histidine kinase/DNA-binding response OmpR family regulator
MKQKVLVVDDNPVNCKLITYELKKVEAEFVQCNTGNKAIETLKKDPDFDLILMDIQMPGLNGFETMVIIKENENLREIPVIFITAFYSTSEFIQKGFDLGAYDYITKPYDVEILKNKVILFLSLRKQQRQIQQQTSELKIINRNLKILNECNTAVIHSKTETELFQTFCNILVSYGNYPFVFVGKVDADNKRNDKTNFTPIAFNGTNEEYTEKILLENIDLVVADCTLLNDLNQNLILKCTNSNCEIFKLYDNSVISAYILSLRIKEKGDTKYVLNLYSNDSNRFDNNEMEFLNSLSENLVFGLAALHEKEKRIKYQQALKSEKEELSITLAGITDGVISASNRGKIFFFNNAACSILEFSDPELNNNSIFNLFNIITDNGLVLFNPLDVIQNESENKGKSETLTIQTLKGTKKILSLSISHSSIFSGDRPVAPAIEGLILVFQDITEKIRISNQLALSQKMESVGLLASGIAHEINNPMQYIGNNTTFLKNAMDSILEYDHQLNSKIEELQSNNDYKRFIISIKSLYEKLDINFLIDEIQNAIESNQNGIERVTKIVQAMKNFAHPSEKAKAPANINTCIETTATISKNEWKYVSDFDTILNPNLPMVNCTVDEINQVILNMIINAVHAIEAVVKESEIDKGKITIESKYDNEWVYIEISDTGIGIPKENILRVFDPFFTTKEVGKGTGQGLAISHDIIVNKHEGRIQVQSEPMQGTKFVICLPRITN